MRDLIQRGYLSQHRIIGPPKQIDFSNVPVTKTGDYSQKALTSTTEKAQITGDIVAHYLKFTPGELGVTFATSVKLSEEYAAAFRDAGVPAAAVSANTPEAERARLIDGLARGELRQLVNVDLFGEGVDIPAISVVIMARKSMSLGMVRQQMGRALRPDGPDKIATIIDHVGNIKEHGPPDKIRAWTLDAAPKSQKREPLDVIINQCFNPSCMAIFEGFSKTCPQCGQRPVATKAATDPEAVDGDLIEYTPELLAMLTGEAAQIMLPPTAGMPAYMRANVVKRIDAQTTLREAISLWAGYWRDIHNSDDSASYRRFYKRFGIDVATATTLRPKAATPLEELIRADIGKL